MLLNPDYFTEELNKLQFFEISFYENWHVNCNYLWKVKSIQIICNDINSLQMVISIWNVDLNLNFIFKHSLITRFEEIIEEIGRIFDFEYIWAFTNFIIYDWIKHNNNEIFNLYIENREYFNFFSKLSHNVKEIDELTKFCSFIKIICQNMIIKKKIIGKVLIFPENEKISMYKLLQQKRRHFLGLRQKTIRKLASQIRIDSNLIAFLGFEHQIQNEDVTEKYLTFTKNFKKPPIIQKTKNLNQKNSSWAGIIGDSLGNREKKINLTQENSLNNSNELNEEIFDLNFKNKSKDIDNLSKFKHQKESQNFEKLIKKELGYFDKDEEQLSEINNNEKNEKNLFIEIKSEKSKGFLK